MPLSAFPAMPPPHANPSTNNPGSSYLKQVDYLNASLRSALNLAEAQQAFYRERITHLQRQHTAVHQSLAYLIESWEVVTDAEHSVPLQGVVDDLEQELTMRLQVVGTLEKLVAKADSADYDRAALILARTSLATLRSKRQPYRRMLMCRTTLAPAV